MPRLPKAEKTTIKQKTRQKLLDAAAAEFAQEGYQAGNINRISKTAGFAKGTIYNYFPSKAALMRTLLQETARLQVDFIRQAVARETTPQSRLKAFFQAGFDFVHAYPDHARVAVSTVFGPDLDLKQYEYQAYQPLFALFSQEVLADGIQKGAFRPVAVEKTTLILMMLYLAGNASPDMGAGPLFDPKTLSDLILNGISTKDNDPCES